MRNVTTSVHNAAEHLQACKGRVSKAEYRTLLLDATPLADARLLDDATVDRLYFLYTAGKIGLPGVPAVSLAVDNTKPNEGDEHE